MKRITVILKNGKEFSFDALEVEVVDEIGRVRWYGASGKIPLRINPAEVAAIYYEKLGENNGGDTEA